MESNLSINELETLISHLHIQYKDYEIANRITPFTQRWESMLLMLQRKDRIFTASSYESDDQIFKKIFMFPDVELSIEFDIRIALSICKNHIPVKNIPLKLFEYQSEHINDVCYIYHQVDDNVNPTLSQPIVIADIPIVPDVLGYVIDGNHRVSCLKSMRKESVQAYLLDEVATFICIRSMLHKAIYFYMCDISDIICGRMTDPKLYLRIGYLEDYCKKKFL